MMNLGVDKSLDQLWGEGAIRVFISHTHEHKVEATEIQSYLNYYGIASFVAHEDIEPMKEWETEIERALFSMDLFIALLTERFSESKWTDQEVGVAFGRRVPIIPIRLGKDPYGFMGKYQAVSGSIGNSGVAEEIFQYTLGNGNLKASAADAFIKALANSGSFSRSNSLARYFADIDELSPEQEESLVRVFNSNNQVSGAFNITGSIIEHLKRTTDNDYEITDGQLELKALDDLPW